MQWAELKKLATKQGVTLGQTRCKTYMVSAVAPPSFVFRASGTHEVVFTIYDWINPKSRAYCHTAIAQDIQQGMAPCPEGSECEWCNETME